jgi:hypothetical protein
MKKRVVNIILLIGVLVIWIFVLKKSFNFFDSKNKEPIVVNNESNDLPIFELKKDTFLLGDFRRDPFLERYSKRPVPVSKKNIQNKKEPSKVKNKVLVKDNSTWPKLQYFGFLKGNNQADKLAVIKINGKLHRIRERGKIENITVKKVYKDSVLLVRNRKTKMVLK